MLEPIGKQIVVLAGHLLLESVKERYDTGFGNDVLACVGEGDSALEITLFVVVDGSFDLPPCGQLLGRIHGSVGHLSSPGCVDRASNLSTMSKEGGMNSQRSKGVSTARGRIRSARAR